MKKIFIIAAASALLYTGAAGVCAYNTGDVIGSVHYSNLDTYINNYPINAYYMDGRQVVCAEDLRDYGFNVTWNATLRALFVEPDYTVQAVNGGKDIKKEYFLQHKKAYDVLYSDIKVYLNGNQIESFCIDGRTMIPIRSLEVLGRCEYSAENNYSKAWIDGLPVGEYAPFELSYDKKLTVVLDAGHGKSSWLMTDAEKSEQGYFCKNGTWGEWRHWKNGTANEECFGSGCRGDRACWYPMVNGDRVTEPEINLQNVLYAKWYLENELGYNVRLTRSTNDENPSFSKRVSYCYPNCDMTAQPDAVCYVCIHSNAGGGRGSGYIAASGTYRQKWITSGYVEQSNLLGNYINNRITAETSLSKHGNGRINGLDYMILFNKCPVPAAYLEIGFFDSSDLNIIRAEHNNIGRAIAYAIDEYMCDL